MILSTIRKNVLIFIPLLLLIFSCNVTEPGDDLPPDFRFESRLNASLHQDIIFTRQAEKLYVADLAFGVELTNLKATFDYNGEAKLNGTIITSGETALEYSDNFKIEFNGHPIVFRVKRQHVIPVIHLKTENGVKITSTTTYVNGMVTIDGKNIFEDLTASAQIRGRGNSTWKYYDKKPYRIKFTSESPVLGMASAKSWVLLANYRDPTNFMNAVAFDMARFLEIPYTNSNRFAEVYLNDEYIGMYQVTEQVQQGKNRVNIDKSNGVLLNLDLDDGPMYSPEAGDNFNSSVYELPVAVKHPEDLSPTQLNAIRQDFAVLESLIKEANMAEVAARLDIQSLIDFLIIQEMTRNVELVSPRSMYMYKDGQGIYHFGPVWDFDGGFAFDWASMSTGHNYFGSQSWLMGSSNPSTHPHSAYNYIPGFFVDMFRHEEFVDAYKDRWNRVAPGMLAYCFEQLDRYALQCESAMKRNAERWPIDKDYKAEIPKMKNWLSTRATNYTEVMKNY